MGTTFQTIQVAKVTCSHCGSQRRFAVPVLNKGTLQQLYALQCRRCGTPDNALELALEPSTSTMSLENLGVEQRE